MRRVPLSLIIIVSCVMLSGCGASKEAKEARQAGIEAIQAGNYGEAVVSLDQALGETKGKVGKFQLDVLKYRGEAEYELGDYEAAIHTYDILIEVDKERAEYLNMRSMAKARSGQLDSAMEDYTKAAAGEKDSPFRRAALLTVGQSLEAAGEFERAAALYEQEISTGTASANLYNQMGLCYMAQKDYDKAISYFEAGLALTDTEGLAKCKFNQAAAYEYKGDFARALTLMQEYVAQFGSTPEAEKEIIFLKSR